MLLLSRIRFYNLRFMRYVGSGNFILIKCDHSVFVWKMLLLQLKKCDVSANCIILWALMCYQFSVQSSILRNMIHIRTIPVGCPFNFHYVFLIAYMITELIRYLKRSMDSRVNYEFVNLCIAKYTTVTFNSLLFNFSTFLRSTQYIQNI